MCDIEAAVADGKLCQRFLDLKGVGYSGNEAARALSRAPSWFSTHVPVWLREGDAGLLPKVRDCGAKPVLFTDLPDWFLPAARFFYTLTNRNWKNGSTPEAIFRTVSLPHLPSGWKPKERARFLQVIGLGEVPTCPEALREAILARKNAGKPMLPPRQLKQIIAGEIAVVSHRAPRNAWLDYVQSPGSLMLTIDELSGMERYIEPGELSTIDDGTINAPCCVAVERPGDPCFDRWGVMLSRFQFLLIVDHRTGMVTGWNFTARPRASYRAEDLTAAMHVTFQEHGLPRAMVMEHGVSAAKLVSETLRLLDVRIIRASSPHQKVVEGVFNKLWTKLSVQFPNAQVGRFRGEEEETNRLMEACRRGAHDPRRYFPMLPDMLRALREVIAEHNASRVQSRYGTWIPGEWFTAAAPKHLRPLDPASAWKFSPVITEPLKVKGMLVSTTVNYLPGYSQKFAFESPALSRHHGELVKLFFNPFAPVCDAMVVHAESGELIGPAQLFDREAKYTRRALGYGMDEDIGRAQVRSHAQAVQRYSQAVRPGRNAAAVVEARDGAGNSRKVEIEGANRGDAETRSENNFTGQSLSVGQAPDVNGVGHASFGETRSGSSAPLASSSLSAPSRLRGETPTPTLTPDARAARLRELQEFEAANKHLFT